MKLPLSIFIITKNEADRLQKVLAAVAGIAQELVVVDSGSVDATMDIARQYGAKVILNVPFLGYGPQKRLAEDVCTQPWLLNLDADEVVSDALLREIQALFGKGDPDCDAYKIPVVEVLPGETFPRIFPHQLTPVRLYRRDKGRYSNSIVHDRVEMQRNANVGSLKGSIYHYSIRSLDRQLSKHEAYSTLQVQDFLARGRLLPRYRVFTEFPIAFLKAYFGRKLFLRGAYGYLLAMNHAIFRHMRMAKIYEFERFGPEEEKPSPETSTDKRQDPATEPSDKPSDKSS